MLPVDLRLEYQGIGVRLPGAPIQLAVQSEMECLAAMCALAFDLDSNFRVT